MTVPKICYEKAFWIVLGVMATVITTTGGIVYAMVLDNQERSISNQNENAETREVIKLIPRIYENQIIICTSQNLPCK